jgi:hypothetical protein
VDDNEVVVRITATPVDPEDGWRLADQVLAAIDKVVTEDVTLEHVIGDRAHERPRRPVEPRAQQRRRPVERRRLRP